MDETCSTHGEEEECIQNFCKEARRRPLGRPKRWWEENIKLDFRGIGLGGMGWSDLTQDKDRCRAAVNMVINLWVPYNSRKFLRE